VSYALPTTTTSTYLDLSLENEMCVTSVGHAEYAAKVVGREVANVADLELWRLDGMRLVTGGHSVRT